MTQKSNKTVIPEAFQFLLEFTNLSFEQGIASVFRPKKELKRTPTVPPAKPKPLTRETIAVAKEFCKQESIVDSDKFIKGLKKNRYTTTYRAGREYSWSLKKGDFEFDGASKCYPSDDELKAFFKSKGIVRTATRGEYLGVQERCCYILNAQVNLNNGVKDEYDTSDIWSVMEEYRKFLPEDLRRWYLFNYRSEEELDCVLRNVSKYIDDGTIPLRIYAELLNFINSNDAKLLRQCSLCGRFFIKKSKKRNLFCNEKCKIVFHQPSRQDGNEAVRKIKQSIKEFQQKEDYQNMVKWLKSEGETQARAEAEAHKWIIEDKKSLKEYKRTKGRMYGIL
ncbi:MAG: hypothetical protein A2W74_03810 [Planctomycetes bacterium RIFCSPLOWO2_12_38_17]|nr:MAG: hypothetical protein A2W74_03810 [Planctomycetes bacterium RIFCSPLOWO2_12_38_17]